MEPAFWQDRWKQQQIAFHKQQPNKLLREYFSQLSLPKGSRIVVPLCGKTTDLPWLIDQDYEVVGIELNQGAVENVVDAIGGIKQVHQLDHHTRYRLDSAEIFLGDIFDLTKSLLGPVDAIYDRAALVAFPANMRSNYAQHLMALTNNAPQFLISYEYDQAQTEGPPFSVTGDEISALYQSHYKRELIAQVDISGPLANRCSGHEIAWLLSPP